MTKEEMERGFQEIWKLFKETDMKFKETDMRFKETDIKFRETDRDFKELDKKIDRVSNSAEKTIQAVNALTGKWSKFVEGLIAPAVERLFKERGIDVNLVSQRVKRKKENHGIEIDILAVDSDYAVLIEAKSTLKVDDVKEHIERLEKFKFFFPEYADKKVIGAVGGIVIDEDSDKYAYRQGMFVITESGDSVRIINDKKFKPKVW